MLKLCSPALCIPLCGIFMYLIEYCIRENLPPPSQLVYWYLFIDIYFQIVLHICWLAQILLLIPYLILHSIFQLSHSIHSYFPEASLTVNDTKTSIMLFSHSVLHVSLYKTQIRYTVHTITCFIQTSFWKFLEMTVNQFSHYTVCRDKTKKMWF